MQHHFTTCEVYTLLFYIPSHAGISAKSQLNSISDMDGEEGNYVSPYRGTT